MSGEGCEAWLFRHGQSASNAGEPTRCPASTPLTPLGAEQARLVAAALPRRPDLVAHSSYLRAAQTAEAILDRYPDARAETWPAHEFTYLAPARYDGTTALDRRPAVGAYWDRLDPEAVDGEGAESFAGFMLRVRETIERLRGLSGFVVLCVHGQFMRGVLCELLDGARTSGRAGGREMAMFRGLRDGIDIPSAALLRLRLGRRDWLSGVESAHLSGCRLVR